MAKKKNSNKSKPNRKYGEQSKFYGLTDLQIETKKETIRGKRAEQAENKARRDRRKRRQNKGIGKFAPPDLPDTGSTPTPGDFELPEMPDFQGMLDAQSASYSNQLDSLREEQRQAADDYRREQAEAQRQFELDQRTMLGNEARAGQQTEYKFGSISGRKRGGTFGFRRRKRRLMGGIGSAVSAGSGGGTLNV